MWVSPTSFNQACPDCFGGAGWDPALIGQKGTRKQGWAPQSTADPTTSPDGTLPANSGSPPAADGADQNDWSWGGDKKK